MKGNNKGWIIYKKGHERVSVDIDNITYINIYTLSGVTRVAFYKGDEKEPTIYDNVVDVGLYSLFWKELKMKNYELMSDKEKMIYLITWKHNGKMENIKKRKVTKW